MKSPKKESLPMNKVCPIHGEPRPEQVENVLSKLSDEDLGILADVDPNMIAIRVAGAVASITSKRCLAKIQALKLEPRPHVV